MDNIPPGSVPEQPEGWIYRYIPKLIELTVPELVRAWGRTLKIRFRGLENIKAARTGGGFLFAMWHGNLLVPVYSHRDRGLVCLVSPVWEGELIGRGLSGLGYRLIRASSNYDSASGMRTIYRELKRGSAVVIIVDGPEGPRRLVKQGIVALASLSGFPVVPSFGAGNRHFHLPTWDRQEITLPFSSAEVGFGEPIYIPRKLKKGEFVEWGSKIKSALFDLEMKVRDDLNAL